MCIFSKHDTWDKVQKIFLSIQKKNQTILGIKFRITYSAPKHSKLISRENSNN